MMAPRKASERGYANHGWLESWHSFSYADYDDPCRATPGGVDFAFDVGLRKKTANPTYKITSRSSPGLSSLPPGSCAIRA
jgi:hypothetical protein